MSEEIKVAATEKVRSVSLVDGNTPRAETILLCRNSLVSMGIKHLLEGTCFALTSTAADERSIFIGDQSTAPTLFIIDGSDLSSRIVETAGSLRSRYPDARIAVIADRFDVSFVKRARDAGVNGFCRSASNREVLIKSLELVMLGEAVLPTDLLALLLDAVPAASGVRDQDDAGAVAECSDPKLRKLSTREAEILHCLTEGAPNKLIARKLDVAEATVKVHIKAILRKIGAANRTQAAMWATTHLPANRSSSLRT
jgi:two-component system, NarL family, nitrate/nitrite response regulator NarL